MRIAVWHNLPSGGGKRALYEHVCGLVCDNHSEDRAWEFFQEQAARDKRIRISQARREGLYANWNNCIRQARGEHVYIATSDDTMSPDFLEKMVATANSLPPETLAIA